MSKGRTASLAAWRCWRRFDVEDERALYPIIEEGRRASERIATMSGPESTPERRRLLRARQEGQEAESTLLRATFGLVRARVLERGYHFYNEDLEAAGVEGLVNALHRFDPQKGNRFATYANYWIMKLVNQAVQQQAGLSDAEMRLILSYQRLERSNPAKHLTKRDVGPSAGDLASQGARSHAIESRIAVAPLRVGGAGRRRRSSPDERSQRCPGVGDRRTSPTHWRRLRRVLAVHVQDDVDRRDSEVLRHNPPGDGETNRQESTGGS